MIHVIKAMAVLDLPQTGPAGGLGHVPHPGVGMAVMVAVVMTTMDDGLPRDVAGLMTGIAVVADVSTGNAPHRAVGAPALGSRCQIIIPTNGWTMTAPYPRAASRCLVVHCS